MLWYVGLMRLLRLRRDTAWVSLGLGTLEEDEVDVALPCMDLKRMSGMHEASASHSWMVFMLHLCRKGAG